MKSSSLPTTSSETRSHHVGSVPSSLTSSPNSPSPHQNHQNHHHTSHHQTHHHTFLPPHSYMIQQQEPTSLSNDKSTLLAKKQVKQLRWIDFISGSMAAIVSDTLLQPLDTVKTRQQFVGEVVAGGQTTNRFVYRNVFDAFWTIARQEGMRGLFRGWVGVDQK